MSEVYPKGKNWFKVKYRPGDTLAVIAMLLQVVMLCIAQYKTIDVNLMDIFITVINVQLLRWAFWPIIYRLGSVYIIVVSLYGIESML